jgi:predicted MFS family arabinose efflux permease
MKAPDRPTHPWLVLALVVLSTVLGLAGTDLVLPAVPSLPSWLGGDIARAQLVIAAYVGGTAAGLIGFGVLGDHFSTRRLFIGSLLMNALVACACMRARDIDTLIALRALQGAVAAGPAVFAPGIVRALFDETRGVRAIGLLGSIEALAPAVAPIIGVWLLGLGGWQLSFEVIAALGVLIAVAIASAGSLPQTARRERGNYLALLGDAVFLRYALSQAFVLGGLLTFVFGMPAVFVHAFGGSLSQFIVMQICGIAGFMLLANLAGHTLRRFGPERLISVGTIVAGLGALATFTYALAGGRDALVITALFVPVNAGLGLRGPPGFYRAVLAARNDDARGAALVILGILGVAAIGTAVAAPFVASGLIHLAGIALVFHVLAIASLVLLPKLGCL